MNAPSRIRRLSFNLQQKSQKAVGAGSVFIFLMIPFLLILFIGCRTASKTAHIQHLAEDNKDVIVLAHLIRDYMRKTHSIGFSLADILKNDTLGRISKNFTELEIGNWPNLWAGGYTVYFKFAMGRNKDAVKLMPNETIPWTVKTKKAIGRNANQLAKQFDGEIHFYYPERHYHIKEILLKGHVSKTF